MKLNQEQHMKTLLNEILRQKSDFLPVKGFLTEKENEKLIETYQIDSTSFFKYRLIMKDDLDLMRIIPVNKQYLTVMIHQN